jgi:hypothetical protein
MTAGERRAEHLYNLLHLFALRPFWPAAEGVGWEEKKKRPHPDSAPRDTARARFTYVLLGNRQRAAWGWGVRLGARYLHTLAATNHKDRVKEAGGRRGGFVIVEDTGYPALRVTCNSCGRSCWRTHRVSPS